MKSSSIVLVTLGVILGYAFESRAQFSRPAVIELSTQQLLETNHERVDAKLTATKCDGRDAVELAPARPGGRQQLLVLDGVELRTGVIEFDYFASAKNPFVGVAFHLENESSYEAVYFRAFRFQDTDPVGRRRAVQYISHPERTWRFLRERFPDTYENPCPLQPDRWHRMKFEILNRQIRVFANDIAEPVLVVERPFTKSGTRVALWTGANSKGVFGPVRIQPSPSDRTGGTPSSTSGRPLPAIVPATGKTTKLLPKIDPAQDAIIGKWTRENEGLAIRIPTYFAFCTLPAVEALSLGNYDLNVAFTRTSETNSVNIIIPILDRRCMVLFGAFDGEWDGLGMVNRTSVKHNVTRRRSLIRKGQRHEVSIRVRVSDPESVSIGVYLDNKEHTSWRGKIENLDLYQAWKLPPNAIGAIGASQSTCVFHAIDCVDVK